MHVSCILGTLRYPIIHGQCSLFEEDLADMQLFRSLSPRRIRKSAEGCKALSLPPPLSGLNRNAQL